MHRRPSHIPSKLAFKATPDRAMHHPRVVPQNHVPGLSPLIAEHIAEHIARLRSMLKEPIKQCLSCLWI